MQRAMQSARGLAADPDDSIPTYGLCVSAPGTRPPLQSTSVLFHGATPVPGARSLRAGREPPCMPLRSPLTRPWSLCAAVPAAGAHPPHTADPEAPSWVGGGRQWAGGRGREVVSTSSQRITGRAPLRGLRSQTVLKNISGAGQRKRGQTASATTGPLSLGHCKRQHKNHTQ